MDPTARALQKSVESAIPSAVVEVASGSPGHYALVVKSEAFQGRPMLECHRMVYAAIAPLMAGESAPVHAIDTLKTIAS
jgi:stress-induced morphogen